MTLLKSAFRNLFSSVILWAALDVLLAIALLGLFIYVRNTTDVIAHLRDEISRLSFESAQMSTLRLDSEEAERLLPELRRMLPDENQLLFVSAELSEVAKKTGVEFGFQFGSVQGGGDVPKTIGFNMNLGGSFSQFLQYLTELGTLPYFIKISGIELSGGVGDGDAMRATFSGVIFIR